MDYPEHSIARRLLDNDPEALGLVIRWISNTLTWPRFWVLRQEWSDLVQETLAQVVESLQRGRYDPAKEFRFYVQGIARHTAARAVHEAVRWRKEANPAAVAHPPTMSGLSEPDVLAVRQLVRRVMDHASEDCRMIIRLYFLEEKGYEEIGAEMMVPVGTVKSRLFRCLGEARKALRAATRRQSDDS